MTGTPSALVEPGACSAPRLRALAAQLGGAPACVIGTEPEAQRARDAGIAVLRSIALPLGSVPLSGRVLRRAFPSVRPGARTLAVGPRAADAARALGAEPFDAADCDPSAVAPLGRDGLRAAWGAAANAAACLLLASPAGSADAHAALDVAGRAAILGRPIVLVVHPGAAGVDRALRLSSAAGGAWRIAIDARADDPELLAGALDAAIGIDVRRGPGPAPSRGFTAGAAAFARGCAAAAPAGDPLGARLAARAGIPTVAAACSAAARSGAVPEERRFEVRRPNEGARLLHAILSAASR